MRRAIGIAVLFFVSFGLLACATPYGPYGMSGGYKDRKIAENKYIVAFYGNGNTSGQTVWNYWIYRCADLTLLKGYDFFSITRVPKNTSLADPDGRRPVEFTMLDPHRLFRGHQASVTPVYYYTYTVTTYSSRALVTMYKAPAPKKAGLLLDARTIRKMLAPYVASKGKQAPPDKKNMLIRAMVEVAIRSHQPNHRHRNAVRKGSGQRM